MDTASLSAAVDTEPQNSSEIDDTPKPVEGSDSQDYDCGVATAAVDTTEPQNSSNIDNIQKSDVGQDDHEIAEDVRLEMFRGDSHPGHDDHDTTTKVLEMNTGIANPEIKISRKRKRGDEVDEPLSEPKRKVLITEVECDPLKHVKIEVGCDPIKHTKVQVGCDPIKHTKVMGGSLQPKLVNGGSLITNSKCRRHQSTGLRTTSKPTETNSFTQYRWTNHH